LPYEEIKDILRKYKTVAIVGLSRNPEKQSYRVAKYLQKHGYSIIPIHPTADKILGKKAYPTLLDVPEEKLKDIGIVDIFRPSQDIPPIGDQVMQLAKQYGKPRVIWMQLGIINQEVARKAEIEGLTVIMDKCMMKEHKKLTNNNENELEKIRAEKMGEMIKKSRNFDKLMAPIKLTDANFSEKTQKYPLMLVDFWAPWCGPCRMIAPIIEELAKEYAGKIAFGKLNSDENPETATRYNVMGIPTLLIMKNAKEVDRLVGAAPKNMIENRLKKFI
jgi:thioredoxin